MPGFVVNGLGSGAPSTVKPYYKHTWEILQFVGDVIGSSPQVDRLPLIYLKEASLPSWSFEKEEIQGASLVYKFAKSIKWNDIKFTWYDTVGLAVKVKEWRDSIWTPANGLSSPDDYKKISKLKSYTFSWKKPVSWAMFNSWPSEVKIGDLTYTESEVKLVEVNLTYDWAEETIS